LVEDDARGHRVRDGCLFQIGTVLHEAAVEALDQVSLPQDGICSAKDGEDSGVLVCVGLVWANPVAFPAARMMVSKEPKSFIDGPFDGDD
jgi:hypothetical protein